MIPLKYFELGLVYNQAKGAHKITKIYNQSIYALKILKIS